MPTGKTNVFVNMVNTFATKNMTFTFSGSVSFLKQFEVIAKEGSRTIFDTGYYCGNRRFWISNILDNNKIASFK